MMTASRLTDSLTVREVALDVHSIAELIVTATREGII